MSPQHFSKPIINRPFDPPEWYWLRHSSGRMADLPKQPGRYPATGRLPKVEALNLFERNPLRSVDGNGDLVRHLALVNDIRSEVASWQDRGYSGATRVTRNLISHWSNPEKDGLYFAQRDAILTAIWLHEVAPETERGRAILGELEEIGAVINDGVLRICHQMATGTGKTAVMAATILWQTCNHIEYSSDPRFTNRFLAITPGITVKERLEAGLQYMKNGQPDQSAEYLNPPLHLVPPQYERALRHIRLRVANYHKFIPRDPDGNIPARVKEFARKRSIVETEQQVIDRVLGQGAAPMIVFNDEAHHCHQGTPGRTSNQGGSPYVWFNAMRMLHGNSLIHGPVRDFSATPSFIEERNAPLFPWIVSQYDLQDAESAGIVKIMRLPPDDGDRPAEWDDELARNIYAETDDDKNVTREDTDGRNRDLKAALQLMYENWQVLRSNANWKQRNLPPVLAVVVNSVKNANRIFDYIAGWQDDGRNVPGQLGNELSNIDVNAHSFHEQPRTILVHSRLEDPDASESGETQRYLKLQAAAYRSLYPKAVTADGVPLLQASNRDVLRTVLNSVGKAGQPGEQVRCVVSVGMLTEGWDARTVTHVVGFRRFGTQLLCEQVSGRALRRVAYDTDEDGFLYPEFADILGIPFDNLDRKVGATTGPDPPPHYDIRVLQERANLRCRWPNVVGYERAPGPNLLALQPPVDWTNVPTYVLPDHEQADRTEAVSNLIGIDDRVLFEKPATCQEFQYLVAKGAVDLLTEVSRDDNAILMRNRLFEQALAVFREAQKQGKLSGPDQYDRWPSRLTVEPRRTAEWLVSLSVRSISGAEQDPVTAICGEPLWLDSRRLQPHQSNRRFRHETLKSEVKFAVCDSNWEVAVADALDSHPDVIRWMRNERLGWTIPYRYDGMTRSYEPDFLAVANLADGRELNIVIEVKGKVRGTDDTKKRWTEQYWLPAVNLHPEFRKAGPWGFLYIDWSPVEARVLNAVSEIIASHEELT